MSECSLLGWLGHFFLRLLCYFTHQAHFVQWKLIFPCSTLHYGCKEGLRIEKSGQPHRIGKIKIRSPALQLLQSYQEVNIPARETIHRGIC